MNLVRNILLIAMLSLCTAPVFAQPAKNDTPAPSSASLRDLAWLIGRWEFRDRAVTANDSYDEQGTSVRLGVG